MLRQLPWWAPEKGGPPDVASGGPFNHPSTDPGCLLGGLRPGTPTYRVAVTGRARSLRVYAHRAVSGPSAQRPARWRPGDAHVHLRIAPPRDRPGLPARLRGRPPREGRAPGGGVPDLPRPPAPGRPLRRRVALARARLHPLPDAGRPEGGRRRHEPPPAALERLVRPAPAAPPGTPSPASTAPPRPPGSWCCSTGPRAPGCAGTPACCRSAVRPGGRPRWRRCARPRVGSGRPSCGRRPPRSTPAGPHVRTCRP